MKKKFAKNKKTIAIVTAALLLCAAIVLIIVLNGGEEEAVNLPFDPAITVTEESAMGLKLLSLDSIAGVYLEDGSDTPTENIFTATFRNEGGSTLRLAGIILNINGTEYRFEVTTIPAGATVRAMETGKQAMPQSIESCVMSTEYISWFENEPSLCESTFEIEQRDNTLIVTNISDSDATGPVYIYYKNFDGEMFIGGITYQVSIPDGLSSGESVALPAGHFYTSASKLMFVYAPYDA